MIQHKNTTRDPRKLDIFGGWAQCKSIHILFFVENMSIAFEKIRKNNCSKKLVSELNVSIFL